MTKNQQPESIEKKRRGRKPADKGPDVVYVMCAAGADGLPVVTASFAEQGQALIEAVRQNLPYYKLEKYVPRFARQEDGAIYLSGEPADK